MRDRSTAFWLALQLFLAVALADSTQNTTTTGSNNLETRVGWYAGPTERGTLTLVYSCLATIITCTWTVLHLNVPALEDESWRRGLRKAKWMAITILFPEFIFAKAICELRSALHGLLEFDRTLRESGGGLSHKISGRKDKDPDIVWTWETKFPRGRVAGLLYPLFGLPRPSPLITRGTTDATTAEHDRENVNTTNISSAKGGKNNEPTPARSHTNEEQDQVETPKTTIQKWSLTHSYLANMGGLVYIQSTRDQRKVYYEILTGVELGRCYIWGEKDHPLKNLVFSEEEINDKSKADWLLKTLSILQISWLILTVLARFALELPLTQLEIVTLAFSVFAIATFTANWWKPKDISTPIRIPYSTNAYRHPELILQLADPAPYGLNGIPSFISWLVSPAETREQSKRTKQDRPRVENDMVEMQGSIPLLIRLMVVAGFIFGGLHCLAWSFVFPSRAELLLWRIASIGSALVPFISLVASIWLNRLVTSSLDKWLLLELQPLAKYGPEYIKLLTKPDFSSKWSRDEEVACYSQPAGSRNFEFPPTDREQEELRKDQNVNFTSIDIHTSMKSWQVGLYSFYVVWQAYQSRRLRAPTARHFQEFHFQMKRQEDRFAIMEFWEEYEKSYIQKKAGAPLGGLPCTSFIKETMNNFEKKQQERTKFTDRACRVVAIISGISYAASRLTILVLVFTSLRNVPIGVYEATPWTRFLPSFS